MTKKKKKKDDSAKPWCFYCDRIFNDEPTLIQHQKAKHYRCPTCNRKLNTAQGLTVHSYQVHKVSLTGVPGAKEGRESLDVEIFGMAGIPEGMKPGGAVEEEHQAKRPKLEVPASQTPLPGALPVPGNSIQAAAQPAAAALMEPTHVNPAAPGMMPAVYPGHQYPPVTYPLAAGAPTHMATCILPPQGGAPMTGGFPPGMPPPHPHPYGAPPMQPPGHPPLGPPRAGIGMPSGPIPTHQQAMPGPAGPPSMGGYLPPPGGPLFPVTGPSVVMPGGGSSIGPAGGMPPAAGMGGPAGPVACGPFHTAGMGAQPPDSSLVWQDEDFSMEERRAMLAKYSTTNGVPQHYAR